MEIGSDESQRGKGAAVFPRVSSTGQPLCLPSQHVGQGLGAFVSQPKHLHSGTTKIIIKVQNEPASVHHDTPK